MLPWWWYWRPRAFSPEVAAGADVERHLSPIDSAVAARLSTDEDHMVRAYILDDIDEGDLHPPAAVEHFPVQIADRATSSHDPAERVVEHY